MGMNRRRFLGSMVAVAAARVVRAQLPAETANLWGSPVIDCHFHPRPTLEANLAHLNGSGCQAAYMLARLTAADDVKRFMAQEPTRFAGYSVSTDVSAPDAVKLLTEAVKAGAHGFGEVKYHVDADGPEMRRLYAAAAELNVPVTLHFQEVSHTPTEGVFNTGFKRFDKILKEYSKNYLSSATAMRSGPMSARTTRMIRTTQGHPSCVAGLPTNGSQTIPTSSAIFLRTRGITRLPAIHRSLPIFSNGTGRSCCLAVTAPAKMDTAPASLKAATLAQPGWRANV